MKYRLNDGVRDFIKSTVKPEFVDDYITRIENIAKDTKNLDLGINGKHTKLGITMSISLHRNDHFTTVEELVPYVWYPSEKFDGNPDNYFVVHTTEDDYTGCTCFPDTIHLMFKDTTYFMYIERPKR